MKKNTFNLFLNITLAFVIFIVCNKIVFSQEVVIPTINFNGKLLQINIVDHDLPVMWGNSIYITHANSNDEGKKNTEVIVHQYKNFNNGSYAANICTQLKANGHDDWYLPSMDELMQIYENRQHIGNFINAVYWSSTEDVNGTAAHTLSFPNGYQMIQSKSFMARIRCIRVLEEDANEVVLEKPKMEKQTKDSGQSQSAVAGKNDSQDQNLVSNPHVTETTISYNEEESNAVNSTENIDQHSFRVFFEKYDEFDNCQHFIAEMKKWMEIFEHTLKKAKAGNQFAIDELKEYVSEDSPYIMVLDIDYVYYSNSCKDEFLEFNRIESRLEELQNEYENLIE
jgi:hypothetical protein